VSSPIHYTHFKLRTCVHSCNLTTMGTKGSPTVCQESVSE